MRFCLTETNGKSTINMAKLGLSLEEGWEVEWIPRTCSVSCLVAVAASLAEEVSPGDPNLTVSLLTSVNKEVAVPDLVAGRTLSTGLASPLKTSTKARFRSSPFPNR
jgi:hypothetical protein